MSPAWSPRLKRESTAATSGGSPLNNARKTPNPDALESKIRSEVRWKTRPQGRDKIGREILETQAGKSEAEASKGEANQGGSAAAGERDGGWIHGRDPTPDLRRRSGGNRVLQEGV
jgi:hypothetical protein